MKYNLGVFKDVKVNGLGLILCILFSFWSCKPQDLRQYDDLLSDTKIIHKTVKNLSDVIVHDIFSPPQASRIYAYATIAGYEVMCQTDPSYLPLGGRLNGLTKCPKPDSTVAISYPLAAIAAHIAVGTKLIFSEDKMASYIEEFYTELRAKGVPKNLIENSKKYGNEVAQHILAWVDKDNYKQTRSSPKFTITDQPGKWKPTPPAYIEAIEPDWKSLRPFIIDSSDQFRPEPPSSFDMTVGSNFYNEMMEVYNVVKNADEEHRAIASFWDCNPYVMNVTGHVMYATKKITPGGHWIGITKLACEKSNSSAVEAWQAYALTSIALADGFISCWDEKYRSNLIRPETIINEMVDDEWFPILQTPPFPEYTSGHSVISNAAAVVLTKLFGDNFEFSDDTELEYGLPVRKFTSFYGAANEAAISRLYGGIHYRPAIEVGVIQGKAVGKFVVDKLLE